jgi:hypothetical protein
MRWITEKRWIAHGIIATIVFCTVLTLISWSNGPHFNLALWDGGLFTTNFAWADALGFVLQFGIGAALAWLFERSAAKVRPVVQTIWVHGTVWGVGLWLGVMIIGLPLYDAVSPLAQTGLILAPGLFAWRYGIGGALAWLLASIAFGISLSYLFSQPQGLKPIRF